MQSLNNSDKEDIRKHIYLLTHFDPAIYLPTELFLHVCTYLEPRDLLTASTVSRAWRERAYDERLWQLSFAREGWMLDKEATKDFEQKAAKLGRRRAEAYLKSGSEAPTFAIPELERRESRKRRRGEAFNDSNSSSGSAAGLDSDTPADSESHVRSAADSEVDEMEGLETEAQPSSMAQLTDDQKKFSTWETNPQGTYDGMTYTKTSSPSLPANINIKPPSFQNSTNRNEPPRLSWPYLYKQRRRLEANWENERYKTFQLPQIEYQEEGHTECVYTIQHTARHLVSGSRDKTIRIWDLHTNRLKVKPLEGHQASVLCLQFDERPEQDLIVSGGSDSSVIIWKFSTGEMIKHIYEAHEESVLNLRFDERYIVTCSKDKTIKIWNRHALARDSPLIPTTVIEDFADPARCLRGGRDILIAPFTHLSTIRGHGAAVNAVMIHGNTIVSASGDRTVKAWDIASGKSIKNYTGHAKGIACVQFDGRRVVSGSSDNTVRIFDAEQQAEVACLTGHANLVRTVQARFGDLHTTTDEELRQQAFEADQGFHRAVAEGMPANQLRRRHQTRGAGSSRPEDMTSIGAKIPPGGGGSRWARIVSGSYDERVIVWKREKDGNWVPKTHLTQIAILRAQRHRYGAIQPTLHPAQQHMAQVAGTLQSAVQQTGGIHATVQHAAATNNQLVAINNALHQTQTNTTTVAASNTTLTAAGNAIAGPANAPNATAAAAAAAPAQHQPPPLNAAGPANNNARDSCRLFKLQFDARRIICCSQNKTIVGWDFANGDEELENIGEWSLETA